MSPLTTLINFSTGVAGLVLTLLGLMLAIFCRPMEGWTRGFFVATFIVLIIYSIAVLTSDYAVMRFSAAVLRPSVFMESLMSSLMMPMLCAFMLKLCDEPLRKSRLLRATLTLWGVYFALLIYTQFSTVIYSVSDDGVYRRGALYPVLLVAPAMIMLLNLIGLWRRRKRLTRRQFYALFVCLGAPLLAMLIQMFSYGLLLVAQGTILGALAMFVLILSEQVDLSVRHAEEKTRADFALRVLQMRPHFIYNAMTSIYYLVDTDPEAAKSAILGFSKYLHENFSAVVKTRMVPFEEEFQHTQAYLAVEQARFGSRLEVIFETAHTDFELPPLTLEPIVENAVKHGMDPECDPLRVVIRTRALENGSEITVENNGLDFMPAESDGESVGLNSVRDRLDRMCGGTVRIAPRDGGGTIATLWIPEVREKDKRSA